MAARGLLLNYSRKLHSKISVHCCDGNNLGTKLMIARYKNTFDKHNRNLHTSVSRNKSPKLSDKAKFVIGWNKENYHLFGEIMVDYEPLTERKTGNKRKQTHQKSKSANSTDNKDTSLETGSKTKSKVEDAESNLDWSASNSPVAKEQFQSQPQQNETPVHQNISFTSPQDQTKFDLKPLDCISSFPLFQPLPGSPHVPEIDEVKKVDCFVAGGDFAKAFPGVTSVLNDTRSAESQYYLDLWKSKMTIELGADGFAKHQTKLMVDGGKFHGYIQQTLQGVPVEEMDVDDHLKNVMESVSPVVEDVHSVKLTETFVRHPLLHYSGAIDCVATYRDQLCVIDWKKSAKPKPSLSSTFDNPLQIAAYIGAINFDNRFQMHVDRGVLVIAYEDGVKANVHTMTRAQCLFYWSEWLQRLHTYWTQKLTNLQS